MILCYALINTFTTHLQMSLIICMLLILEFGKFALGLNFEKSRKGITDCKRCSLFPCWIIIISYDINLKYKDT